MDKQHVRSLLIRSTSAAATSSTGFPTSRRWASNYDEATYKQTLEMAVKAVDIPAFRKRQAAARAKGRHLGIGFATFFRANWLWQSGFSRRAAWRFTPGWETVIITVDPSGFVEARIGSSPHGQGLRTTLAQIIADELGVTPEIIKVVHGDTDRAPYGWGTFASRSLVISGGATLIAAQKIRTKLIKIASHMLEAATDDIVLATEGWRRSPAPTRLSRSQSSRAKPIHRRIGSKATFEPVSPKPDIMIHPVLSPIACHVAIVDVDVETAT